MTHSRHYYPSSKYDVDWRHFRFVRVSKPAPWEVRLRLKLSWEDLLLRLTAGFGVVCGLMLIFRK